MNVSLYQAAAAMNASSRWQELIANNLAAAGSPAYKRQEVSFDAVQAGVLTAQRGPNGGPVLLPTMRPLINFQAGELKFSGLPTDLALEGEGFFEVQTAPGVKAYTRDGEFHISPAGQLVTKSGFPVLGENGPIQVNPANPEPITVSATGEVSQGAELRGKLRIVTFNQPQLLTQTGGGLFLASHPGLVATPASDPNVRQGVLEASNVSPMTEMASLIAAMRQYEANQRIIQLQDERMGKAISELGHPA